MNDLSNEEEMTEEEKLLAKPACERHASPMRSSHSQPVSAERAQLSPVNSLNSRTDARVARISRSTAETQIELKLNLDGTGRCNLDCPIGFFNHMLSAFCKHGMFDLEGILRGDLDVDQHHLIEDTGIALGSAFDKALGSRKGILRAGFFLYPMDESLCRAAVDFGGRPYLVCNAELSGRPLVGGTVPECNEPASVCTTFQTDCFEDFWQGFVTTAKCNLHLDTIRGRSDHHKMEGLFKAAGRAIRAAVTVDARAPNAIPSTKGVIC